MKLNRFFVRFNWSESAFQFLVLSLFFLRFRSMNNYGIDRLKYEFFQESTNQANWGHSSQKTHPSLDRTKQFLKLKEKIAVHPKIHLKSHQFQSDKWKFQFTKAQSSENSQNLQTSKIKQKEGQKPISKEFPSNSSQKTKIEFEIP